MQDNSKNKFVPQSNTVIPQINCELQEFTHEETGAKHYHIKPLDPFNTENGFSVFFKTMPQDSKGVAHILEHSVLCGSKNFPVKNPFFNMLKRSASTFMNAMTGPDYTMYPFATQNEKDFNNLLQVYLDSVFHANLDEMDFLQEGWRYEFEDNDPEKALNFKGVVLNEMKGAMGSETREVFSNYCKAMFKDTVYRHNSGGMPEDITKLTYSELQNFYNKYYHPSNSVFFTYGTIGAEANQEQICKALQGFVREEVLIPDSEYLETSAHKNSSSITQDVHFNAQPDEAGENHIFLSWFGCDRVDLQSTYEINIFQEMIFSPESNLQKYLEENNLLASDLNGFHDHVRQTNFSIGVKSIPDAQVSIMQQELMEKIQAVIGQDFSKEKMMSLLDGYELRIKEQRSRSMPYSIELISAVKDSALASKSIVEAFEVDKSFKSIREKIANGTLIKEIGDKYFKPEHAKTFISKASSDVYDKAHALEKNRLMQAKKNLTESEKHRIVKKAKQLALKQNQVPNIDVLPKLLVGDINFNIDETLYKTPHSLDGNCVSYLDSNGVTYVSMYFDLLKNDDKSAYQSLVSEVYSALLDGETGWGELSDVEADIKRSSAMTAYRVSQDLYTKQIDANMPQKREYRSNLKLSAKTLDGKGVLMAQTMAQSFFNAKFENLDKIKYCLTNIINDIKDYNNIGQQLAKVYAKQDIDAATRQEGEKLMPALIKSKAKVASELLENDEMLEKFKQDMQDAHTKDVSYLKQKPFVVKIIGSNQEINAVKKWVDSEMMGFMNLNPQSLVNLNGKDASIVQKFESVIVNRDNKMPGFYAPKAINSTHSLIETAEKIRHEKFTEKKTAIFGPTDVAYNYKVLSVTNPTYLEEASLMVGANLLKAEHLHKAIREKGGAYGASAGYSAGSFVLSTYRDPQVLASFAAFEECMHNFVANKISQEDIDSSVIAIAGNINSVKDNYSQMEKSFEISRSQSKEARPQMVAAYLKVTPESIKSAMTKFVLNQKGQFSTYAPAKHESELLANGWTGINLVQEMNAENSVKKSLVSAQ